MPRKRTDFSKGDLYMDYCSKCKAEYLFFTEEMERVELCASCSAEKIIELQAKIRELTIEQEKYL